MQMNGLDKISGVSGVLSMNYIQSRRGGHGHPTPEDEISDDRACANTYSKRGEWFPTIYYLLRMIPKGCGVPTAR